jgi:hypothetical protein
VTTPFTPALLESHVGILGKTGSGKSNLAKTIVEGLLADGARVCVIDPTGTWYGLRLTRDRRPSPYQVVMFGGVHADIAIGRNHGEAVAETIGTTSTPAVIDTRTMTVGDRTAFFTGFAETLLQRNRGTLHLVVDEAHLFAPQGRVADPKSGAMVHAANNLVSLGRGVGIRVILISQRPAKLHKDSLTQIETLVAMRLIAPQDRAAIADWIKEWADPKVGAELIASLPSLPTGDAWMWAPGEDILERFHAPLAATLDTGRPSDEPIELAPIDVAAVQSRLDEAGAEQLANDPAALKKRIVELERQLRERPAGEPQIVSVPAISEDQLVELRRFAAEYHEKGWELINAVGMLSNALSDAEYRPSSTPTREREERAPRGVPAAPARGRGDTAAATPAPAASRRNPAPATDAPLSQSILAALASGTAQGRPIRQLGILTGYSSSGGFFRRTLAALREQGLVDGTDPVRITDRGLDARDGVEPIETGRDLLNAWLSNSRLGSAAASFLPFLAEAHPDSLAITDLAARSGYSANGGYFRRSLKKLRDLNLANGTSEIRIAPELVEVGL